MKFVFRNVCREIRFDNFLFSKLWFLFAIGYHLERSFFSLLLFFFHELFTRRRTLHSCRIFFLFFFVVHSRSASIFARVYYVPFATEAFLLFLPRSTYISLHQVSINFTILTACLQVTLPRRKRDIEK